MPSSITDLTGYTWVGNSSSLSGLDNITIYNLSFTSNNTSFITFKFELYSNRPVVFCLSYDSTNAFIADGTGWIDEAYKTIQITGGTDVTNSTLILPPLICPSIPVAVASNSGISERITLCGMPSCENAFLRSS